MDRLIALIGEGSDAHLLALGKALRANGARVLWLDPLELARSAEELARVQHTEVPHAAFVRAPVFETARGSEGLEATKRRAPLSYEWLRNLLSRWENAGARVFRAHARVLTREEMAALPLLEKSGISLSSGASASGAAPVQQHACEPLSVFVADGELLASFRYEGSERDVQSGAPRYTALVLSTSLSLMCERVVRLLRVRFAEVRAVRMGDSIEINQVISGPDFLEPEAQTGVALTQKLCGVLLADDARSTLPAKIGPLRQQVEAFEASLIERALVEAGGNQARAAATLGLPLRTLVYKIGKYQLRDRDLRAREQGL